MQTARDICSARTQLIKSLIGAALAGILLTRLSVPNRHILFYREEADTFEVPVWKIDPHDIYFYSRTKGDKSSCTRVGKGDYGPVSNYVQSFISSINVLPAAVGRSGIPRGNVHVHSWQT